MENGILGLPEGAFNYTDIKKEAFKPRPCRFAGRDNLCGIEKCPNNLTATDRVDIARQNCNRFDSDNFYIAPSVE